MIEQSSAFARYVDQARQRRNALWRIILGILLIAAVWLVWTIAALLLGGLYIGTFGRLAGVAMEESWPIVEDFFGSPAGTAAMLASFAGMLLGVWIAARLLHGRPFRSLLGWDRRLSWVNLIRGLLAALIVSAASEAAFYVVDPTVERSAIAIGDWLAWLLPLTALIFVQISAEELVFRGYLTQSLAALYRHPLIWGAAPALLFTLLHWDSSAQPEMNAAMLASIAAFAAVATILLYRTGDLGAAMGVHLGINFFSVLIVSRMSWLEGAALFSGRSMDGQAWTLGEAAWLAIISLATFAVLLLLLLERRSPLRVVEPAIAGSREAAPASARIS